ncbi:hypothetical protein [Streptosporangium sp. NPDC001681]|uniref:hypothetical protein n=1 Tax=Streptosporangium sp. NPDC001681 TaxID=3154395 RepID=UPI0033244345
MTTSENGQAGVFAMTRLFSIVHLRSSLLMSLGVTVLMVVGLRIMFSDWEQGPGAAWLISLGIPVGALLVLWLILAVMLRPQVYLRDMNQMLAGQSWAHWHYDEADWKAANDIERRRDRRNSYTTLLVMMAIGLVSVVVGFAMSDDTAIFAGALITAIGLVGMAIATTTTLMTRSRPQGEIYISPLGVYRLPGGYAVLYSPGVRLHEVDFVEANNEIPAFLRFTGMVQGRFGETSSKLADVAVPSGGEDEARALVQRFQTEVLKSR